VIDKSLKGLEQHMHERIKAVQDIKISAEDLLQREFDANRNILTKIQYLEPLSNDFNSYSKEGLGKQKESLQAITDLNRRMDENNKLLTDLLYFMQDSTLKSRVKSIFGKKKRVK
jgi:glutamine synthetase type III